MDISEDVNPATPTKFNDFLFYKKSLFPYLPSGDTPLTKV
jgi:hypothetical protein